MAHLELPTSDYDLVREAREYTVHQDMDKQTKALATILKILEDARFDHNDGKVKVALAHLLEIAEAQAKKWD